MNKYLSRLVALTIVMTMLLYTTNSVSAEEKFWSKGAAYSTKVTSQLNKVYSSSNSVVVINAAATWNVPSGKERLITYSRCDIVKSLTSASACIVREMSTEFFRSNSSGTHLTTDGFITKTLPKSNDSVSLISMQTSYFINNFYINAGLVALEILINSAKAQVSHSISDVDSKSKIIYKHPNMDIVDIPSKYKYNEVAYYLPKKGMWAHFNYQYNSTQGFYVTAASRVTYSLSIPTGGIAPLVIDVTTSPATLTHSIGF